MINPLVSIIIPTFNRAHLIGETLGSILTQTYQNWECIIVDDGSTDNTVEVVNKYIEKDKRFKLYYRPSDRQPGGNAARNYGFEVSNGEYVKWFDSDDIMYPEFLQTQVSILTNNKLLDFCTCQWEYFYEDGKIAKIYINLNPESHPLYAYLLDWHVFATPSPLWNRTFLANKNLFDVNLFRSQEADFHFRMLSFSPKYVAHADFLYKVRRGHESIESTSADLKKQLSVLHYFENAFNIVHQKTFEEKSILQKYLIFRILGQIYIVVSREKNLIARLKYYHFQKTIFKYGLYLGIGSFIRIQLGFSILLLFNKGYSLIILKKFDLRKK
ncbi:glycosyltransferase family 2 protein [Flavobacterium chungangensis]|uniref:Glycosyltransferase family 2 protein n=1 Tax=Flavobacterium chungangensis TaxID=2708132 RepID=A0ABV8ZFE3_9FLAO